ncbi:MAG: hypothetical protein AAB368_04940 [bacterium]
MKHGFLTAFPLVFLAATACAQGLDWGAGLSPGLYGGADKEQQIEVKRRQKAHEVMCRRMSEKVGVPAPTLVKLRNKGFSYLELAKLGLIAKKSGAPFEELARRRERGTTFLKMATSWQLDLAEINREAFEIRTSVVPRDYLKLADEPTGQGKLEIRYHPAVLTGLTTGTTQ